MNAAEARSLIALAVGESGGQWADLGAGGGTFTRALASLLAPRSRVYAVDRDPEAVAELRTLKGAAAVEIIPVLADFTEDLRLPVQAGLLDGILLANALHFVPNADEVLGRLVALVRPQGRVVVVEYDRRAASRWVPYPIPAARWPELAESAGLTNARITATRPSQYEGMLYAAVAECALA